MRSPSQVACWASAVLGGIWMVGLFATGGCKPKVAGPSPDAGGRPVVVASNARSSPLALAIHRYLTMKLARRPPCEGEQITAVDGWGVEYTIARSVFGDTARGRMRVFVRHSTGERSGTETVLCKVRQRGAAWTVTWCRVGQTSFGLGITLPPVVGLDDASLGVDTCDALDAYFRCFTKTLPAPGGANVLRAWRTQKRAYRNILKEPGGGAKVAKECGEALERIRKNSHKSPRYKDCVK